MSEALFTYDEIALKGGNRPFFERILRQNVWLALGSRKGMQPRKVAGRSHLEIPPDLAADEVVSRLCRVPGVANVSIAEHCPNQLEAIKALAEAQARTCIPGSFAVVCKRAWKNFPRTSPEIAGEVGAHLKQALQLPVDLEAPSFKVYVLITEKGAYVSTRTWKGLGGLAVGTSGKAVALLSGGFDSPVAAWRMFLRGCQVVFCHFLNAGQDPLAVKTKIQDLVGILTRYQLRSTLYVVPFDALQRELIAAVPAPQRMLAYRRVMMRIAAKVAAKEGAQAVVTGDSVGQVASQTLANLHTIWSASTLPVLAPLIGTSKRDIIDLAREIGTYETSNEPYPDCCQFMIATHPATSSTPARLLEHEALLPDLARLEEEAFRAAEVEHHVWPAPAVKVATARAP